MAGMTSPRRRATYTTAEAARYLRIAPSSFRATMARLRAAGVDLRTPADQWPDARTPLWDAARLRAWHRRRPGPGNWTKR